MGDPIHRYAMNGKATRCGLPLFTERPLRVSLYGSSATCPDCNPAPMTLEQAEAYVRAQLAARADKVTGEAS